jgi:hypothetical protein
MSHAPVTIVASGGVPVVDATPLSGTALNNPTSRGIPVTPVSSGARPITIVSSGAPPVVFVNTDGVTYMPGGSAGGGDAPEMQFDNELNSQLIAALEDF